MFVLNLVKNLNQKYNILGILIFLFKKTLNLTSLVHPIFKLSEKFCEMLSFVFNLDLSYLTSILVYIQRILSTISNYFKIKCVIEIICKLIYKKKNLKKTKDSKILKKTVENKESSVEKNDLSFEYFMFQDKIEENLSTISLEDSNDATKAQNEGEKKEKQFHKRFPKTEII